MKIGLMLKLLS